MGNFCGSNKGNKPNQIKGNKIKKHPTISLPPREEETLPPSHQHYNVEPRQYFQQQQQQLQLQQQQLQQFQQPRSINRLVPEIPSSQIQNNRNNFAESNQNQLGRQHNHSHNQDISSNLQLDRFQRSVRQQPERLVTLRELRVGYYFVVDELLVLTLQQKSKLNKNRQRLAKWHQMAFYAAKQRGEKFQNQMRKDNIHFHGKNSRAQSASTAVSDNQPNSNNNSTGNNQFRNWLDDSRSIIDQKTAEEGLRMFYNDYPAKFLNRLQKGPPAQYRWIAWKIVTYKSNVKLDYTDLLNAGENSWTHQIRKDTDRTFPGLTYFSDSSGLGQYGQAALFRTLNAYSHYNPRVGYCQVMNFIFGFFLLLSGGNQEESYKLFVMIAQSRYQDNRQLSLSGLEGFFQQGFPLLDKYRYYFFSLFHKRMPKLAAHLEACQIPDLLWIDKWFISLYLYQLPLGLCIRVWDNLITHGVVFMFKFALTLLKYCEKDLLSLDFGGICEYIKRIGQRQDLSGKMKAGKAIQTEDGRLINPQDALPSNMELIIKKANEIKIPSVELQQIRDSYRQQIQRRQSTVKLNAFSGAGGAGGSKISKIDELKNQEDLQDEDDDAQQQNKKVKQQQFDQNGIENILIPQRVESPNLNDIQDQKANQPAAIQAFRSSIMKGLDVDGGGGINNIIKDNSSRSKRFQQGFNLQQVKNNVKVVSLHLDINEKKSKSMLNNSFDAPLWKQRSGAQLENLDSHQLQSSHRHQKSPSSPRDTPQLSLSQDHFNRTQSVANSYNYSVSKRSSSRGAIAFPGSQQPSLSIQSKDGSNGINPPASSNILRNVANHSQNNANHHHVSKNHADWNDIVGDNDQNDLFHRSIHNNISKSSNSSQAVPEQTWIQQSARHDLTANEIQDLDGRESERTLQQSIAANKMRDLTEDGIQFVSASQGWGFFHGHNIHPTPSSGSNNNLKNKRKNQQSDSPATEIQNISGSNNYTSGFNPSKSVANQKDLEQQQKKQQKMNNYNYNNSMTPYTKGAQ